MWKENLSMLILLTEICLKVQSLNEENCYTKFCYSWDGKYEPYNSGKCKTPYSELEIYDNDGLWEITQFMTEKSILDGYYVILGIKCDTLLCWWKKLRTAVDIKSVAFNPNNKNGVAYFKGPHRSKWFMEDIREHPIVVICMRDSTSPTSRGSGTSTNNVKDINGGKDKGQTIIAIALGTASLALIVLMAVLLTLVLKRRRRGADKNNVQNNSTKSSSFKHVTMASPPYYTATIPTPSSSSTYADIMTPRDFSDPASSSTYAEIITSDTYANAQNFQTSTESQPSAILYGELGWSKKKKDNKENINEDINSDDVIKDVYENGVPVMMTMNKVGPMGDEYAIINKG